MAYSTLASIQAAIGSADLIAVSDLDGDGIADAGIVAAAIEEGDRHIDTYGRKRFSAARLAASAAIAALSRRLAVRIMRRDRRMTLAQDVEDEKRDQKWLEGLAKGDVTLETDSDGTATELVVDKYGTRDEVVGANAGRKKLKGFW